MDIDRLKCKLCGKFPDAEIYECAAKDHIVCVVCVDKSKKLLCTCGAMLVTIKLKNPIEQLVGNVKSICRYVENGCTWKFTPSEMDAHMLECKFRPYRCITSTLNVLSCNWIGLQHEIEDHLVKRHNELGPIFRFAESSSLVFKDNVSIGGLKVVDAFSKRFLLHFFSDAAKKTLSFIMIYFGRREESDQYCYDLILRAGSFDRNASNNTSKNATSEAATDAPVPRVVESVKFVERCYSDSENLTEIMEEEKCMVLSHRQVRKYLNHDKLYFNYKVRKVDGSAAKERKQSDKETAAVSTDVSGAASKVKPRPPPLKFIKKGMLSLNTNRSSSSSSSTSNSSTDSSSSDGKPSSSSQGTSAPGKCSTPTGGITSSRSPSSASTITVCSTAHIAPHAVDKGHAGGSLSSINCNLGNLSPFDKPTHSHVLTPSINKLDLPPTWTTAEIKTTSFSYQQSTEYLQRHVKDPLPGKRYPPTEQTTTAAVCKAYTQPYKVQDDRPYLLKYPTNCLYKPKPKW